MSIFKSIRVWLGAALVGAAFPTLAAKYYVDASLGNDTWSGKSGDPVGSPPADGPWRSLARIRSATLLPGDSVLLKCGSRWSETLSLSSSGTTANPIVVGTNPSGCANRPSIDGAVEIAQSAWQLHSGSIYKTKLAAGLSPGMIFSDGARLEAAHHPNRGHDTTRPTSLYARIAANADSTLIAGKVGSTYLPTGSDLGLPAGVSLSSGISVRFRTTNWWIEERKVTSVSSGRLYIDSPSRYPLLKGYGYYLLGALWMLDSPGEWYFDASNSTLYVWMPDGGAPGNRVTVGGLASGVDLSSRSNVAVDGLDIRRTDVGVSMPNSTSVVIRNSSIQDTLHEGIAAGRAQSPILESNVISRSGWDAISHMDANEQPGSGARVSNNVIQDSGVIVGATGVQGLPDRSDASIRLGDRATVVGNRISNVSNYGIHPGIGSTVANNVIDTACLNFDDCGGIYVAAANNNSTIRENVVRNILGSSDGLPDGMGLHIVGIYLDGKTTGVQVTGNTVAGVLLGLHLHDASGNSISGNTFFGNRQNQIWMQEDSNLARSDGDIYGNSIVGNRFFPLDAGVSVKLSTKYATLSDFATFDSNRYSGLQSMRMALEIPASGVPSFYTFAQWQAATANGVARNLDTAGHMLTPVGYTTYRNSGSSVIPNGDFATGTTGWKGWNATAPYGQVYWDVCPQGHCLRYVQGASSGQMSSPNFSVVKGQTYRLTFDLKAGTAGQKVAVMVRRGGGGTNGYEGLMNVVPPDLVGSTAWTRYSTTFVATQTINKDDPVTKDFGARVDFGLAAGQTLSFGNVDMVPIKAAGTPLHTHLLTNDSSVARAFSCPEQSAEPAVCPSYFKFSDDSPVVWPIAISPFASEIIYSKDLSVADADSDGIADDQDYCPASAIELAVNSRGCGFGQVESGVTTQATPAEPMGLTITVF